MIKTDCMQDSPWNTERQSFVMFHEQAAGALINFIKQKDPYYMQFHGHKSICHPPWLSILSVYLSVVPAMMQKWSTESALLSMKSPFYFLHAFSLFVQEKKVSLSKTCLFDLKKKKVRKSCVALSEIQCIGNTKKGSCISKITSFTWLYFWSVVSERLYLIIISPHLSEKHFLYLPWLFWDERRNSPVERINLQPLLIPKGKWCLISY